MSLTCFWHLMNLRPGFLVVEERQTAARSPHPHLSNGWLSQRLLGLELELSEPWLWEGRTGGWFIILRWDQESSDGRGRWVPILSLKERKEEEYYCRLRQDDRYMGVLRHVGWGYIVHHPFLTNNIANKTKQNFYLTKTHIWFHTSFLITRDMVICPLQMKLSRCIWKLLQNFHGRYYQETI